MSAPDAYRSCPSGPPKLPRLANFAQNAEGLDGRFVLCSYRTPWTCRDPEAVPMRYQPAAPPPNVTVSGPSGSADRDTNRSHK